MMNNRNRVLDGLLCVLCVMVPLVCLPVSAIGDKGKDHWVATWSTANNDLANPDAPGVFSSANVPDSLENQTIREIVHTTIGGREIRIRLSNAFGAKPITFDSVYAGLEANGAALAAGTNHDVTFGGSKTVMIPEGSEALSDPIRLSVGAGENLVISLFTTGPARLATGHSAAFQTNFISTTGNFAADESASAFTKTVGSWYFLAEVDVLASQKMRGAIVALGDSITDGSSTKPDTYVRWTDVLARRMLASRAHNTMAVLNSGIGGNRVLTSSPCFGVNALARLDRDAFDHAGVRDIILFEGTNDIGQPDTPASTIRAKYVPCLTRMQITADDLIAGYKQIIEQAHAAGLKIFGATILPYKGYGGWTEQGEAKRQAANHWIKESGAFDGVIDFDAALRDPANPTSLNPSYDSGDHLHPNSAGHEAMANAIDLGLFR
jgi:lysophospholipase L1-like esterase